MKKEKIHFQMGLCRNKVQINGGNVNTMMYNKHNKFPSKEFRNFN